jgi:hypothetical protein
MFQSTTSVQTKHSQVQRAWHGCSSASACIRLPGVFVAIEHRTSQRISADLLRHFSLICRLSGSPRQNRVRYRRTNRSTCKAAPIMSLAGISSRAMQIIRGHLPLVAVGCLTLQLPVLALVFIFRVPEATFSTASFREIALVYVACFVLAHRKTAWLTHQLRNCERAAPGGHYAMREQRPVCGFPDPFRHKPASRSARISGRQSSSRQP